MTFDVKAMAEKIIAIEYKRLRTQLKAINDTEKAYLKMRSVIEGNTYPLLLTKQEIYKEQYIAIGLWGEK
jgi:hypothetical protein